MNIHCRDGGVCQQVVDGVTHDIGIGRQTEIVASRTGRLAVVVMEISLALTVVAVIGRYKVHLRKRTGVRGEIANREIVHVSDEQTVAGDVIIESPLLAVLKDIVLPGLFILAHDIGHGIFIPGGHIGDGGRLSEFHELIPATYPPFESRVVGDAETVEGIVAAIHQIPFVEDGIGVSRDGIEVGQLETMRELMDKGAIAVEFAFVVEFGDTGIVAHKDIAHLQVILALMGPDGIGRASSILATSCEDR